MFLRCVFTTAGFSMAGASFLALRRRLIRARGLRLRPVWVWNEVTLLDAKGSKYQVLHLE